MKLNKTNRFNRNRTYRLVQKRRSQYALLQSPENMMALVEAIAVQAAEDYRASGGTDEDAKRFFLGSSLLSCLQIDGRKILKRLDMELAQRVEEV